jgi:heme/copper-type cytochrome/quinol oxidase subunit 2
VRPAVIVFLLCATACVVGHFAILASVVRRRSAVVDSGVPRPRTGMEILWALVPAIALAILLTATWARVRQNVPSPEAIMKVSR